ncbi:dynein regulatory complex protein 10-like [Neodiprion virginianus]|uniref:dynein regulatory complex protein 10-like n=1 Tax=Neodiprion fabricii TaxID=2872261 RepID=UPI001ED8D532|nr:dynein regulatory complex protein 10-like [Neodiprion fabricii]XP_046604933.1 dynein regulatory complex protein 10-like [Neodiprion virginianus]
MENKLREKRCKVEAELLNCVARYDADIGGRHTDLENLASEFELLSSQRKNLEDDVMVDLRRLHDDLQREKEETSLKILNERIDIFVRNRAARVIQKAWRAYWERHSTKKKKKSRKK